MRSLIAAFALLIALPALAQQSGVVAFDPPNTGGPPSGYRLYRDGNLLGPVSPGESVSALFPTDVGSWVIGVEPFNAAGAGPITSVRVDLGPPPPGPVRNLRITLDCATTSPPQCTVTVSDAP